MQFPFAGGDVTPTPSSAAGGPSPPRSSPERETAAPARCSKYGSCPVHGTPLFAHIYYTGRKRGRPFLLPVRTLHLQSSIIDSKLLIGCALKAD